MAYEPSDHRTSTYGARVALLERVREVKPEVLTDLRKLLPAFREAARYLQWRRFYAPDLWAWEITESKLTDVTVLRLREALTAWAQDHGLNFDWCIKTAIYSLIGWEGGLRFEYGWCYDGHSPSIPISDAESRFVFELEKGWQTDREGEEEFTTRADEAFKQYLTAYKARIKMILKKREHVKTKRKKKPLVDGFDDFKLLALRLVWGYSYAQITAILEKAGGGKTNTRKRNPSGSFQRRDLDEEQVKKRVLNTAHLCDIDMSRE